MPQGKLLFFLLVVVALLLFCDVSVRDAVHGLWQPLVQRFSAEKSPALPQPSPSPTAPPLVAPSPSAETVKKEKPVPVVQATATPAPFISAEPSFDLESLAHDRTRWPKQVALKQSIAFPAMLNGKVIGSMMVPMGTETRVVGIAKDGITAEYQGAIQKVPVSATDLRERVKAAQRKSDLASAQIPLATPKATTDDSMPLKLEWKISVRASKPSMVLFPDLIADQKLKIHDYILGKVNGPIAVDSIPDGDINGWWCVRQYDAAGGDQVALYRLVGQHLLMGEYLLAQTGKEQKLRGLGIILQAGRYASMKLKDNYLASAICDAMILPNISAAAAQPRVWLGKDKVIAQTVYIYKATGNQDGLVKSYKMLLKNAPNRNTEDAARMRLSQIAESKGNYLEALNYLKAIDPNHGMSGARKHIPLLEKKLKNS